MVHTLLNAMLKYNGFRIPVRVGSYVNKSDDDSVFNQFCKKCMTQSNRVYVCKNPDCKSNEINTKEDRQKVFIYGEGDVKKIDQELLDGIKKYERVIKIKGKTPKNTELITLGGSYILPREFDKKEDFNPEQDQEPFSAYRTLHSSLTNGNDIILEYQRGKVINAILRAVGSVIVLLILPFQEKIRELDEEVDIKVSKEEKQLAKQWINSLKTVDVSSVKDTYRQQVEDIITGKIKPKPKKTAKSKPNGKKVSFFLIPKETLKDKPKKPEVKGGKKK